jgi:hypothetical protein
VTSKHIFGLVEFLKRKAKCSLEKSEKDCPVMWCHVPEKLSRKSPEKNSKLDIMILEL